MMASETHSITYSRRSMETKRIQLRGISRSPSDRMTTDGGCIESLNATIDNTEIAPIAEPEDLTRQITSNYLPLGDYDILFIHKSGSIKNYIIQYQSEVGWFEDDEFKKMFSLRYGESVLDVTSIGNTIVFACSEGMQYVLYKDGTYKYLGSKIPEPHIEFQCVPTDEEQVHDITVLQFSHAEVPSAGAALVFDTEAFNKAVKRLAAGVVDEETDYIRQYQEKLWEGLLSGIKSRKAEDTLLVPVFVRYAVRLYDGSYLYQSVPILLGAGHDKPFYITAEWEFSVTKGSTCYFKVVFPSHYTAKAKLIRWDIDGWEDIIESVDLFASTDVLHPVSQSPFLYISEGRTAEGPDVTDSTYTIHDVFFDSIGLEDALLEKGNFYKLRSFAKADLQNLKSLGYNISSDKSLGSQDSLVLQERLPDYNGSSDDLIPRQLSSFNNRILAIGDRVRLTSGYSSLQSTNIADHVSVKKNYAIRYHVSEVDGSEHVVVARNPEGGYYLNTYSANAKVGGITSDFYATPYGLVFYPNTRCKRVDFFVDNSVYTIEMKPHPLLNCSYAFWGLDSTYEYLSSTGTTSLADFIEGESREMSESNKLLVSESSNPFVFPLSQSKTMGASIVGIAVANKALSEGQFGQFPLYVFTTDGIWAMETNAAGQFISSHPLSREVCINKDALLPLDQAVVFVSEKGVMLLAGSNVTELSAAMKGNHIPLENTAAIIISDIQRFSKVQAAASDSTPFMQFMKTATLSYDYSGNRIICMNPSYLYSYVYHINSQTWHKIAYEGKTLIRPLNSYPSCEVVAKDVDNNCLLLDLSTNLSSADLRTERIIIVTRAFTLDAPDVLKTIKDLRVRGNFKKGAVKFILHGSMDGIHFQTISTLRGKAWKEFKLTILADLDIYERISWIDVGYETRFTNRLR